MPNIHIPDYLLQRLSSYQGISPLESALGNMQKLSAVVENIAEIKKDRDRQASLSLLNKDIPEGFGNVEVKSFDDWLALQKMAQEKQKKEQDFREKLSEQLRRQAEAEREQAVERAKQELELKKIAAMGQDKQLENLIKVEKLKQLKQQNSFINPSLSQTKKDSLGIL